MSSITPSVALAALLASAPVWAQSAQYAEQTITPSSFLGVDLQGNFMIEVPECASADVQPSDVCRIETQKAGRFEVRGLPYLPISPNYKLFATVTDGAVNQLVLTGSASNLYLVKELLTNKLGKPSTMATQLVKLKSGASYEAEIYNWSTQGGAVNFERDPTDLGRYSVTFSTSEATTEISQKNIMPAKDSPSL